MIVKSVNEGLNCDILGRKYGMLLLVTESILEPFKNSLRKHRESRIFPLTIRKLKISRRFYTLEN